MNKKSKDKRLEELNHSIKKAKLLIEDEPLTKKENKSLHFAYKIVIELIAGFTVGAFIGYKIDQYFDTIPIFTITCLFLAFFGSMLNIYRTTMKD